MIDPYVRRMLVRALLGTGAALRSLLWRLAPRLCHAVIGRPAHLQ